MISATKYTFTSSNIDLAPASSGVYVLYDGDTITYYGSSETSVRARLRRHHNGNEGQCTKSATHFKWETTQRPLGREAELLHEYEETYGALPRCNDRDV
ncbi:MAG: GIY-YIG nuclease family protein [Planctomycetes bacterium]|nr:GIY-YIG nuclease family protein [Planctomycetota bacterium]